MPKSTSSSYKFLKDKWSHRHVQLQKKLFKKHKESVDWLTKNTKELAFGSLSGLMILASPVQGPVNPQVKVASESVQKIDNRVFVIADLSSALPSQVRPLTGDEEIKIANVLTKTYGLKVAAEIGGLRLNRSYGLIGQEQHLARFPGDSMDIHFDNQNGAVQYGKHGMAPGLGAWGYFTTSAANMTQEDIDREKYYIAVQTFLSPDFNQKVAQYRDFYKYRKMLVVNPQNGKAVIADIADAGPAEWTGKHLGGSPEVMTYLERYDGVARGPVLYFFIEDPSDQIPLGPVEPIGS